MAKQRVKHAVPSVHKMADLIDVVAYRRGSPEDGHFAGWVESKQKGWILFIRPDGSAQFYKRRLPGGAVIGLPVEAKGTPR